MTLKSTPLTTVHVVDTRILLATIEAHTLTQATVATFTIWQRLKSPIKLPQEILDIITDQVLLDTIYQKLTELGPSWKCMLESCDWNKHDVAAVSEEYKSIFLESMNEMMTTWPTFFHTRAPVDQQIETLFLEQAQRKAHAVTCMGLAERLKNPIGCSYFSGHSYGVETTTSVMCAAFEKCYGILVKHDVIDKGARTAETFYIPVDLLEEADGKAKTGRRNRLLRMWARIACDEEDRALL